MLRKRIVIVSLVFSLVLCMVLSGCRNRVAEGTSAEEETKEVMDESVDYVAEYQRLPDNDLFQGNWQKNELTNTEHFMSFTDYIPNVFPQNEDAEHWPRGYCADDSSIYSLDTYYSKGENGEYTGTNYVNILDSITRKISTITYTDDYFLSQPFLIGGRLFAVSMEMDEEGVMDDFFVVELLENGSCQRKLNVCDIVRDRGMLPQPYFVAETLLYYEPANDWYYIISPEENELVVIDKEGTVREELMEAKSKAKYFVSATTKEGRLIFQKTEGGSSTFFYYDEGEKKVLFEGKNGPESGAKILTADTHGRFLFPYNNGTTIVEWDTATGVLEKLYMEYADVDSDEYSHYSRGIDCVMRNENGEVLILKENALRILTAKGPAKKVTITMKPMLYCQYGFDKLLHQYEQTHPGITIDLQPESEWENRDRDVIEMIQEIAAGQGPDVLLLDRRQMLDFDKNDCLLDISDMLSPATKEMLIPGVLDYGRTEDGIKLLSNAPTLYTMFVNKKYVKDSGWTVQDIIDIIEEREAKGEPFEQLIRGIYHPFFVFSTGIFDSPFIDMEEGTCSFDSEQFVKVLEISKRYQDREYETDGNEEYKLLKEDKILALAPWSSGITTYSQTCAALGEDFVAVGYPSLSGNGNYLDFGMGIAVNKNTENYEVIADFANWMFSTEMESAELLSGVPFRTDMYRGRIELPTEDSYNEQPVIRLGYRSVMPIDGKPDGTSYVDEYIDLLVRSRYDQRSVGMYEITSIIWEEADAYFEGDKSAEEVARVIQSRVSLYLMENN